MYYTLLHVSIPPPQKKIDHIFEESTKNTDRARAGKQYPSNAPEGRTQEQEAFFFPRSVHIRHLESDQ
jgi:hypothetical protein